MAYEVVRHPAVTTDQTTKIGPDMVEENLLHVAERAFLRDLPKLLTQHFGKSVAYRGDELLYVEDSMDALYKDISEANGDFKEILVRRVEPLETEIRLNWNW